MRVNECACVWWKHKYINIFGYIYMRWCVQGRHDARRVLSVWQTAIDGSSDRAKAHGTTRRRQDDCGEDGRKTLYRRFSVLVAQHRSHWGCFWFGWMRDMRVFPTKIRDSRSSSLSYTMRSFYVNTHFLEEEGSNAFLETHAERLPIIKFGESLAR